MKFKRFLAAAMTLLISVAMLASCRPQTSNTGTTPPSSGDTTAESGGTTAPADSGGTASAGSEGLATPPEGPDTNYGRPYNLSPVKYDTRQDKYLNSINATVLPIVQEPMEITIWQAFNSTVLTDLNESMVYQEMEKRTNVHINWVYPPVGSETDNFNLRVASDDLPDVFTRPPTYPGGPAKAVDDGIYTDLTPYYERGLMPNVKWIRENRPDINRDWVDDSGRMLAFIMLDIVPSSPWSGLWVRQDWMDELGLAEPKTIADWENVLYTMKDAKGINPLSMNLKDWYGVATNFEFLGSFESGWEFFAKDGTTVQYGPVTEGFRQWLELAHKWYDDGIIDPDFVTRTFDDYIANVIDGKYGAFGMAYGDVGPLKVGGMLKDPKFKMKPMLQPTSYDGQVIHLHQTDSTVRQARDHITSYAVERGIADTLCRYMDYWYSQDGGDLCSYGVLNESYIWTPEGTFEFIHPVLTETPDADFWTLYPKFKLHEGPYLRDSTSYKNEPEVWECIDLWASQDASWVMPDNIAQTPDEATEIGGLQIEINTVRDEMAAKFITGQTPLSEYDSFVDTIKRMNVDRLVELKQAALDRYRNRK